ncbi:MAG: hypothetical protein LAO21_01465 [Acidobacteriia bacterium]|nr:hypothetical protein [Terriglobia bacterium]
MQRKSAKMHLICISLFCLVCLITITGCSKPETKISDKEKNRKIAEKLSYFNQKYNAVIDWHKDITWPSLTIDLQKALNRRDGRPCVFTVYLEDVFYRSASYWAVFSDPYDPPPFFLVVELSDEQYESARKLPLAWFTKYLVVSTITNIEKPLFSPEATTKEGGMPEVTLTTSDTVVIWGKFVDMSLCD